MTGRRPQHPDAGSWVAWIEVPSPHPTSGAERAWERRYVWGRMRPVWMWTTSRVDALRFDSEEEALEAVQTGDRDRGPEVRYGAERIT